MTARTVVKRIRERYLPKACAWMPLRVWHQLLDVDLIVPYYHTVADGQIEHVHDLFEYRTVTQFHKDLDLLLRHYTPVSLADVVEYLDGARSLPKRSVLLTFDDGFSEIYHVVAPMLYRRGIPAVMFLVSSTLDNRELCYPQKKSLIMTRLATKDAQLISRATALLRGIGATALTAAERVRVVPYRQRHILDDLAVILECDFSEYLSRVRPYVTIAQAKGLIKQGFAIGAHSIDHPYYGELSIPEQLNQTFGSMEQLSRLLEYRCQSFAFPYGDNAVAAACFEELFADGRLRVSFGVGGVSPSMHPRNLPRFSMEREDLGARQIIARQFCKSLTRRITERASNAH